MNEKQNIDDLVLSYRRDQSLGLDSGAAEKLIECFKGYTGKFANFLSGNSKRFDNDLREFMGLFGKERFIFILKMLRRSYEPEDLLIETQVALLETAMQYNNITANYKYRLYKHIRDLIKDPLVNFTIVPYIDDLDSAMVRRIDILDEDWISGKTAVGPCAKLSVDQRRVIKMKQQDGYTNNEIAKILGKHRNTISSLWNSALRFLKEESIEE